MNKSMLFTAALLSFCSCVEETDSPQQKENVILNSLYSTVRTKSAPISQSDSLKILSKIQSDENTLMLGRVIFTDNRYVLAIKKEDAIFLGVSEETYNQYLKYVEDLNDSL